MSVAGVRVVEFGTKEHKRWSYLKDGEELQWLQMLLIR